MGLRICLGQLKSYARGYIERVSAGETLEVVRRGKLVAFMVPASPSLCEPPKDVDRAGATDLFPDAYVTLSQLRKNAAPCFDRAEAGEIVGVLRRGRLVARIVAAAFTFERPSAVQRPSRANTRQAQVFHRLLAERRAELCDRVDEQAAKLARCERSRDSAGIRRKAGRIKEIGAEIRDIDRMMQGLRVQLLDVEQLS